MYSPSPTGGQRSSWHDQLFDRIHVLLNVLWLIEGDVARAEGDVGDMADRGQQRLKTRVRVFSQETLDAQQFLGGGDHHVSIHAVRPGVCLPAVPADLQSAPPSQIGATACTPWRLPLRVLHPPLAAHRSSTRWRALTWLSPASRRYKYTPEARGFPCSSLPSHVIAYSPASRSPCTSTATFCPAAL